MDWQTFLRVMIEDEKAAIAKYRIAVEKADSEPLKAVLEKLLARRRVSRGLFAARDPQAQNRNREHSTQKEENHDDRYQSCFDCAPAGARARAEGLEFYTQAGRAHRRSHGQRDAAFSGRRRSASPKGHPAADRCLEQGEGWVLPEDIPEVDADLSYASLSCGQGRVGQGHSAGCQRSGCFALCAQDRER